MITPLHYTLSLEAHPEQRSFHGETSIEVGIEEKVERIVLDAVGLQIESASVDGATATFEITPGAVAIIPPAPLKAARSTIALRYRGQLDESGRGLFMSGDCIVTQLQPVYARRVFPCFDDPRWKTLFDLTVAAPRSHIVIANAPLLHEEELGNRRRLTFATSPPLPTHLFALAVGELSAMNADVDGVPLRFLTRLGDGREAFALEAASRFIAVHSRILGVAYPWPKLDLVAVPEYEAAGMEATSVIYFRESAVLVDDDATPERRTEVAALVAHELAHQWFGSLVSPASWEELWLSEGFATWAAAKALSSENGPAAEVASTRATRGAMAVDSLPSCRALHSAAAANQLQELYDVIAYQKGAAVLRMLEQWLGEETFARGVTLYLNRHAGGHATSDDLWSALREASGEDVADVAAPFVRRSGVPTIRFDWSGPAIRVTRSGDEELAVPVAMKIGLAGGGVERRRVLLRTASEVVEMADEVSWVFGNENAAGYYRCRHAGPSAIPAAELSDPEAVALLADTWDAMWGGTGDTLEYLRVLDNVGRRTALGGIAGEYLADLAALLAGGGRLAPFAAWASSRFPGIDLRRGSDAAADLEALGSAGTDETARLLEKVFANPDTAGAAWMHLKEHWDELQRTVISFGGRGAMTALASVCDRAMRNDIATFFAGRAIPGAERTLRQTLETIDSRLAFREREQPVFDAWLARQSSSAVAADESLRAGHALLNALAAGFHGALVHRGWIEGLGLTPPPWMQRSDDLARVAAALERRLLALFAGKVVIDAALLDLAARLHEDLIASADLADSILAAGHESTSDVSVWMLAALLARQAAVYERLVRGAIVFAELFRIDDAARVLRGRLFASEEERARVRALVRRAGSPPPTLELRASLWSESAPLPALQRSQAAEVAALSSWWRERMSTG
ncbi:MAG TPA: M1 family metallopeptidase [Thermoanaerobaculia bacterium]|nr:M1 family metallopeptidase [Thermoanaerobaculia bacterium]